MQGALAELNGRERLVLMAYGWLMLLLQPLLLIKLRRRAQQEPEYGLNLAQRFGHFKDKPLDGGLVWLHAVSLGETRAAALLLLAPHMALQALQATMAQRFLGDIGRMPAAQRAALQRSKEQKAPLTKQEVDRIKVILVLGLFTIIFWAGFEQAGGLMNLYTQEYTDRMIGSFEVPTAWFQSLNPFFIITLAPIVAAIWIKLGSKEPNSPVKFAMGLLFLAVGFLFMIGAVLEQGGDQAVKTSMFWLVGAYLFHTLGELCLSPIGLSMVTKLAPLRLASLMMGAWFGFVALANYIAGFVGSFVGESGPIAIFGGIFIQFVPNIADEISKPEYLIWT